MVQSYNPSGNYGKQHSVFTNLNHENGTIIKANRLCHI
jgi:hypothetical protein